MSTRHKLYICSIHEAKKSLENSGFYILGESFVKDVDIIGIITEVREYRQNLSNEFLVFKVDDGTGIIGCKYYCQPKESNKVNEMEMTEGSKAILKHLLKKPSSPLTVKMGDTIHVRGIISEFRGKKELKAQKLRLITNVNEESHRVFEMEALYKDVYKLKE